MGVNTKIEWCDMTFNPWHGCAKVSAGCKFCYAETFTKRYAPDDNFWGVDGDRRFFNDKHWQQPLRWNRRAEKKGRRYRVFCGSMCDVFEEHKNPEVNNMLTIMRGRLFGMISITPNLDWLLLTKRPENIQLMHPLLEHLDNILPNVWLGTSVENQEQADLRIPELLAVPAKIRFLSCEPLIDEVNLAAWIDKIDWVIVGGESGNVDRVRPMKDEWAMSLVQQCKAANVPILVKQLGTRRRLTGKGQHMNEWPKELRIREFPG